MFRQYRQIEPEEFIIAGADCSQGGSDKNVCQFFSKTKLDVPLIYHSPGVAATMTAAIFPVLERIADRTGIRPVVGFERNMGGASEMERLKILNKENKYKVFVMPIIGSEEKSGGDTDKLGFNTDVLSRPILVGGLKEVVDIHGIGIFDQDTIDELSIFIENPQGKPEAAKGGYDDTVISLGISWFIAKYEVAQRIRQTYSMPKNDLANKDWRIG